MPFVVVDADRPEALDRHVLDAELVDRLAVVTGGRDVEIKGVLLGIAAPSDRRSDQVTHGVDAPFRTEHGLRVRDGRAEAEESVPHFNLARCIPIGDREGPGPAGLADIDRILQRVDRLDVLGVVGIDEDANGDNDIARADLVLGERTDGSAVVDLGAVLVFVDRLHRQEALARVGQGEGHRTRIEIEHRGRIEGVAIHPDDGLRGDRRRFAAMHEFAKAPLLDHAAEIKIGLGADEIVGRDEDRFIVGRRVGALAR